jgi:hypothetical protein
LFLAGVFALALALALGWYAPVDSRQTRFATGQAPSHPIYRRVVSPGTVQARAVAISPDLHLEVN